MTPVKRPRLQGRVNKKIRSDALSMYWWRSYSPGEDQHSSSSAAWDGRSTAGIEVEGVREKLGLHSRATVGPKILNS